MKIRTVDDLQDAIDAEIAWRKRELSAIKTNVQSSRHFAKETAIRSGITLLYAHWEGAIKNIASAYWKYISCTGLYYNQIKLNFLAVALKSDLTLFSDTNRTTLQTKLIRSTLDKMSEKIHLPQNKVIKTGSNLNSEVFVEIMATLGLDCTLYESSYVFINEVLINMRNKIAHGEKLESLSLDEERYLEIHGKVFSLIETFAAQVSNAAILKQYLNI